MIYKWNLVKAETFKEIFDTFWNKKGDTTDKVLELQNFDEGELDDPDPVRLFFGDGIKFMDWTKYNSDTFELIKTANSALSSIKGKDIDICKDAILSMCMTNEGPRITPLKTNQEHDNLIFKGMIDDDPDSIDDPGSKALTLMSQSFLKLRVGKDENGNLIKGNKDTEGFIRVRAIDLADWKKHITVYAKTGKFKPEFTKDDIKL